MKYIKIINFLILLLLVFQFTNLKAGEPTRTYTGKKANTNLSGETEKPDIAGIKFSPDGTKVFVSDHDNTYHASNPYDDGLHQYTLSTPWDISTLDASTRTSIDINTGDNHSANSKKPILFNNDGKKFFIFGTFGGTLSVYNLTTPYDISSVSASTQVADDGINYSELDLGSDPINTDGSIRLHDADFNNDGTKMYLLDGKIHATNVVEYNLSTPFDPSTASYNTTLNTETDGVAQYGMELAFDDDGTRMYFGEGNNGAATTYKIYVYKLSTPFSISSAAFVGSHTLNLESASDGGTMFTWAFGGNDGKKLYLTTNEDSAVGSLDDYIYEFDLSCPYGIVICETDSITNVGAQVEFAKHVIQQNTSTVFKRFEWLRRNEGKNNLNNLTASIKLGNPLLNYWIKKLPTKIESVNGAVENGRSITIGHENKNSNNLDNFTTVIKSDNPLLNSWMNKLPEKITAHKAFLKEKSSKDKKTIKTKNKNWSYWSHGDISFGRKGDTATSKPNEIRVSGIMFGADKKINKNKFFGAAIRFGKGEIENITPNGIELDTESLSFNLYSTLPVNNNSNLNALLGVSLLRIDQLLSKKTTGERNGKQFFTAINIQSKDSYGNYNLRPTGTFEFGVTQFSEYTDFGTSSTNSQDSYDSLTFKTGNIAAGFKFDNFMDINNGRLSRNGSLEYVQDLTSNIDYNFKNNSANASTTKTVETHSIHNIKGNFGFEILYESGYTFALNYERFQGLDYSSHQDSIFIKFGHIREEDSDFALNYKPLENNQMELSYVKDVNGFDVKFSSNYSLMNEIPDYGANIEVSSMF